MTSDEVFDTVLAETMVKYYGDLLKVSRDKNCIYTLPRLRDYLQENERVLELYLEGIYDERDGQGLTRNFVLNSLIEAQVGSFSENSPKNNKLYSEEIKKLITEGIKEGSVENVVQGVTSKASKDTVRLILEEPHDVDITSITQSDVDEVRKYLLDYEEGFRRFSLWAFHIQTHSVFQEYDFHEIIFEFCQEIINGGIDRGIVCIPPRHSKTQILSIFLPLYAFCINSSSQNIITSYADDVVLESSGYIRTIMMSPIFKKIFPQAEIDQSKRALERWGTLRGGVQHAVSTGGKMTGKGAGTLSSKFSGLFVVDDVIKPADAYSDTVRSVINDRYDNTFMSRLANDGVVKENGKEVRCPRTPMVIIMQRVHDDDLVGHILRGKSGDYYSFLNIPGLIDPSCGSEEWYDKLCKRHGFTHAVPYLYDLKRDEPLTALWPSRKSLDSLLEMQKSTPYTFYSQYMGDPSSRGTGLVKTEWWQTYEEIPYDSIIKSFMTGDTASTAQTYSDYSIICLWHLSRDKKLYLGDLILGKWETPDLKEELIKFWQKHRVFDPKRPTAYPSALYLEDKSSGQFLNQQFARDGSVICIPVPKDRNSKDKVTRFMNTIPYWSTGRIIMPRQHEHLDHIEREVLQMTSLGSGTGNDDFIDNVSDAVVVAFENQQIDYSSWVS